MDNKEEVKVEEQVFGSPIDNGKTKDLRESVNEMQTFLDEPKSTNGSKALLIVIIILVVISLGLGGYIAYDKVFNKGCNKCNVAPITIKDKYNAFLDKIKERDYSEYVSFDYRENDEDKRVEYVLGTDNILYVLNNNEGEITIPGAKGNGGEFKGKSTNIDEVVRIFKINHTDGTGSIEKEAEGLLLLKESGKLTIIRHPEKEEIKEEELDDEYIVDVYTPLYNISQTILIDIEGNTSVLK